MSNKIYKPKNRRDIISDAQIEYVHANVSFGNTPKRDVVDAAILNTFCDFSTGSTARSIIIQHGLARSRVSPYSPPILTAKGRKYLKAVLTEKFILNNMVIKND